MRLIIIGPGNPVPPSSLPPTINITAIERDGKFCGILVALLSTFLAIPLAQPHFVASADGLFHLHRLVEYDAVLRQGVWYPRWAPDFLLGLGTPIFNFYAPLTYYLAEVFHLLGAGFIDSLKLLFAAMILAAGVNAYAYARLFLSPWPALVVAVLYTYNPYFIVNVYYRADAAEALAFVWFPLILWSFNRLAKTKRLLYVVAGSLAYGALILTHNLSALLFSGFLAVYLTSAVVHHRCASQGRWHTTVTMFLAFAATVALSLALTSFFWLPALAEKSLVAIDRMLLFDFHSFFPSPPELFTASPVQTFSSMVHGTEVYQYRLGTVQVIALCMGCCNL